MRTMAGVGPRSSDFRKQEVEPVYLLTQRRSSFPPPPPASARLVLEPVQEPQRDSLGEFMRAPDLDNKWYVEPTSDADDEDDFSDIWPASRLTRRRRGIRVLGALAIMGALAGGIFVLQQPEVRHEALSFVTMGHEDAAVRAGRRIATFVEALRHR
jgi:hypothetical protein